MMIQPWPVKRSEQLGDYHIFKLRADWKTSPRNHHELKFLVIECLNWVNVIAITSKDELVMIEQFRHGSGTVELEIPGGVIDAHDSSPVEAGLRELSEETGFEGEDGCLIGQVFANPAIMNNTCYTVLVRNCHFTSETRFDHGEDIRTRLVPMAEIPELVQSGKIRHAMVVVAFYHYENWRRGIKA